MSKLDTRKIESLLKYADNKARAALVHAPKWPNEKSMKELAKAVIANNKTVVLEGKKFKLRYIHKGYVSVSPANGDFVPCGSFDIESLTHGVH